MKKIAIASIITMICALACAFVVGVVSAQGGWEKTITLPSGEKVLDMRGEWDTLHEFLKSLEFLGKPGSNIVLITQEGDTFSGVSQLDTTWFRKGTQTWKGILDKDGFKEVQVYLPQHGGQMIWVPVTWEISEHGNKIVFVDTDRHRWTFTRK